MKKLIMLSLLVGGVTLQGAADEGRLLRFPSTNGTDVVFTYAGDLYKAPLRGGVAQRLTSYVGYEMFARYSPDGKHIAFTGQYDGNTEVYLMPSEGGMPQRLTVTSTNSRDDIGDRMGPNNIVMTWTPDGKQIIYRNRIGDGFNGQLYAVPVEGGMSTALPLPEGGFCSYAPDGKELAYNRVFREFRTWKHYKGGMADDIWVYNSAKKTIENVTNNPWQDIIPMWIGKDIYFISDRDKTMNIFVYHTDTKQTEKVTNFTDYDVKFPSTDGKIIVFEQAGYLFKLDPSTRKYEKIQIELNPEANYARTELKNVHRNVRALSMAPDATRLAVTARGEVFNVPTKPGVTRNLTRTPGAHERDAVWSPDGRYIAYISDRTGETEIWLQTPENAEPVQLTRDNDTYISWIEWAPNSKYLVYGDRMNRLVQVNPVTKEKKILAENPTGAFNGVSFSPDSRWLVYTLTGNNQMSRVYVMNLETGKATPVSSPMYDASSPCFSSDGKYLIYASARDFNPTYGTLEWNHVFNELEGIYVAMLTQNTPSPFLLDDPTVSVKGEAAPTSKAVKKSQKDKVTKSAEQQRVSVKIDFEGIEERIVKLPLAAANYSIVASDGKRVWYSSNGAVNVFDFADRKETDIVKGASMLVSADGKKAVFYNYQNQKVYVMDTPKGKVNLSDDMAVNLSDMVATVDYAQEWKQIYGEAWRAYRDGFYLKNMHGIDWKAMYDKYAVFLPYVKNRLDLNYVIGELIGELSVGHAYVNEGEHAAAPRIQTGLLGARLSRDVSGFFRIDYILKGASYSNDLFSPLAQAGLNVKEGDFITAVDGVPVTEVKDIYSLLIGKVGMATELTVNGTAAKGGRKIVVKPIANEYPLYHYEWVQNNIEKVNKATDGKVGYIYIPDMGPAGLSEFGRYYYAQLDKEGLIIDDRANGGGNISPMIIERLLRKPYRLTMYRNSTHNGTVPDGTQVGPKVLLINKYSASDGDLFPWSFKANKLGTVIGTRTWGGIIGISGSLPYMDGTDIRVPFFTNYDAQTGQWIVENHGVDPDILLDNNPILEQQGVDEQLNKAIEVVLQQLKDRKPLPKTPAPRTLKDLGVAQD